MSNKNREHERICRDCKAPAEYLFNRRQANPRFLCSYCGLEYYLRITDVEGTLMFIGNIDA